MHKRSSRDVNQAVASLIDSVIRKNDPEQSAKNPAAVALGKLGGIKGGPARAAVLSERRRRDIAKRAAQARWARTRSDER
jgi:hypothetical protein